MKSVVNSLRHRTRWSALIVVLAMALQGMVPTGYMVAQSPADGSIVVEICTQGLAKQFVRIDLATGQSTVVSEGGHDGPSDHDPDDMANAACAQAATALAGAPLCAAADVAAVHGHDHQWPMPRAPPLEQVSGAAVPPRSPPLTL
ncbi:MAG: hypothetical protein AAFR65_01925 [Pseudomonadota bacterium]